MQTPAPIEYERATSVENAIALLEEHGPEARVIAGGHSLLPMMKLRLANPERLIDINDLEQLSYIREQDGEIRHRGADTPLRAARVRAARPALPGLRRRRAGDRRPGGAKPRHDRRLAAQADAAEDLSAVCAALKAQVVIAGSAGERTVSMDEFHVGPYQTAVGDAEILVEVRVPLRAGAGSAHEKVERRAGDWAIVAVSAASGWTAARSPTRASALSAVGPTTIHASRAEELLRGKTPSEDLFARGGRDRLRGLLAERRRARAGRLQAPPRRRAHPRALRGAAERAHGRED